MISLDIETGGIDPENSSILSIGAVDVFSDKEFYIETRSYDFHEVNPFALAVNGFTLEQARDTKKPLPHIGYVKLLQWIKENNLNPLLLGENIGSFDVKFLNYCHNRHRDILEAFDLGWPFGHRFVDLHSASCLYFDKSQKMDKTREALGLPPEQKPHNALRGAKAAKEAYLALREKVHSSR